MDLYEQLYAQMCTDCPNAHSCHNRCEECEEFQDELENLERKLFDLCQLKGANLASPRD